MASRPVTLSLLLSVIGAVAGLRVTPGSECEAVCTDMSPPPGEQDAGASQEIVCKDDEYLSTPPGVKFKECITCLKDSKHVNDTESDISSLFYNLRFTIDTCLFDEGRISTGTVGTTTCLGEEHCLPLKEALLFEESEPENPDGVFRYCTDDDKAFVGKHMKLCLSCLQSSDDHVFLSNFMTVLTGGCAYKPRAGTTLNFTGDLFSTDEITIHAPTNLTQDYQPAPPPPSSSNGPFSKLPLAAVIGLIAGPSALFILATILFITYYRRIRNRKADYDEDQPYEEHYSGPGPEQSLRHVKSFDSAWAPASVPFYQRYRSREDAMRRGRGSTGGPEEFDYMQAALMMEKPKAAVVKGRGLQRERGHAPLPAHHAYIPHIKSRSWDDVSPSSSGSSEATVKEVPW